MAALNATTIDGRAEMLSAPDRTGPRDPWSLRSFLARLRPQRDSSFVFDEEPETVLPPDLWPSY